MNEKLVLGGVTLVAGALGLTFGGAFGMLFDGLVLVVVGLASSGSERPPAMRNGSDVTSDPAKTNCPKCGAVNYAGREECHDCDASLSA